MGQRPVPTGVNSPAEPGTVQGATDDVVEITTAMAGTDFTETEVQPEPVEDTAIPNMVLEPA